MRKICVITGSRAESGLLFWTMKAIQSDPELELQIIATGTHLSPEHGMTAEAMEKEGFTINKKVESLLASDTKIGMAKSSSLAISGIADALNDLRPHVALILGDRFEMLSAATACMLLNIPIAHCHGGESTLGLIDEPIRHSITKMSHFHFTSTEAYRKRVIQLGEAPHTVFNVGALGVENINKLPSLSKLELQSSLDFKFGKKNILVTYHPVTLDGDPVWQIKELLSVLDKRSDLNIIFTLSNADSGGLAISKEIKEFVNRNSERSKWFVHLGQVRYLSVLRYVDAVVGNSSSGIIEVPSFKIPTVDIGMRQAGRIAAESILRCAPDAGAIDKAVEQALSPVFRARCIEVVNPHGSGNASSRIISTLKESNLENILVKKFYNLDFSL